MKQNDIVKYVRRLKKEAYHGQDGRYASFDYCFNYFQEFKERNAIKAIVNKDNLQQSCLHLGFFLASWGMYRGSSKLLQHSCHFLKKSLQVIADYDKQIWNIDANCYSSKENREMLFDCAKKLKESMGVTSDTLVTKIMLGVFGNVPAYDAYFRMAMTEIVGGTFNLESLEKLGIFYKDNKTGIDALSREIKTIDFLGGSPTHRNYTRAKIIDMYGWTKGFEMDKEGAIAKEEGK